MLEQINQLPRKLVKDLDSDIGHIGVYLVQDFDLKLLKRMVTFGSNVLGDMALDEFGLVPQIRHGNVFVLKDKDQPQVLGIAIFMRDWDTNDTVYLFDFAIKEDLQGHGLGFEFLKSIAENLVEQGYTRMSLTVDVENTGAIHLYQNKLGFETKEFMKDEYGQGHDRYYMEADMKAFLENQKNS